MAMVRWAVKNEDGKLWSQLKGWMSPSDGRQASHVTTWESAEKAATMQGKQWKDGVICKIKYDPRGKSGYELMIVE